NGATLVGVPAGVAGNRREIARQGLVGLRVFLRSRDGCADLGEDRRVSLVFTLVGGLLGYDRFDVLRRFREVFLEAPGVVPGFGQRREDRCVLDLLFGPGVLRALLDGGGDDGFLLLRDLGGGFGLRARGDGGGCLGRRDGLCLRLGATADADDPGAGALEEARPALGLLRRDGRCFVLVAGEVLLARVVLEVLSEVLDLVFLEVVGEVLGLDGGFLLRRDTPAGEVERVGPGIVLGDEVFGSLRRRRDLGRDSALGAHQGRHGEGGVVVVFQILVGKEHFGGLGLGRRLLAGQVLDLFRHRGLFGLGGRFGHR